MPILAQLSDASIAPLVQWLLGGSAALFLLNQVLTFWKSHLREQPTPSDTYATKAEHSRLEHRVNGLSADIKSGFERLDQKRSVSIAGLHDDLNEGLEKVNKRIDEMPARLIALLKETKELHR